MASDLKTGYPGYPAISWLIFCYSPLFSSQKLQSHVWTKQRTHSECIRLANSGSAICGAICFVWSLFGPMTTCCFSNTITTSRVLFSCREQSSNPIFPSSDLVLLQNLTTCHVEKTQTTGEGGWKQQGTLRGSRDDVLLRTVEFTNAPNTFAATQTLETLPASFLDAVNLLIKGVLLQ